MHKTRYKDSDKMSDLISDNYSMLLVMSRFGIPIGVGEKSIKDVCAQNEVHSPTFLAVVNFLLEEVPQKIEYKTLSIEHLIVYLQHAHDYFLNFRLPNIRRKLVEAIKACPKDVAFVITQFFDEYVEEVDKHMMYEEHTVFPYVRKLLAGGKDTHYNISVFKKRHDQIELKIVELKNILIKYYPVDGGHLLNSVLYDIFDTEQDLASHNIVEDSLFVPAILELEKEI